MASLMFRRVIAISAIASAGILVGCGDQPNLALQVPTTLAPAAKEVVVAAWPKVKQACVGLDRYAQGIKVVDVQENNTIDVLVSVPDSGSGVPDRYMAGGNTCYFSVGRDGKSLTVTKEGCKALCLDRSIMPGEELDKSDFRANL